MHYHISLFAGIGLLLGACTQPSQPPVAEDTAQVQSYAKSVLNDLAQPSFSQGIEFCGYIFEDGTGGFDHTVTPGTVDFCDYGPAPETTVASFHTHGDYAADYDSEIPSVEDVEGSIDIGFDDYLGTPGGRFWINGANGVARLLCDAGCLKSDPNYRADPTLPVDNRYTLRDLKGLSS